MQMSTLDKSKTSQIKNLLKQSHTGYLPAETVQKLLEEYQCSMNELMLMLLPIASDYAHVPISRFKVGAIALGESGNLYLGANIEFKSAPLGQAIHAEQSVVINAYHHGESKIIKLAVNERPCGHCRQFLYELNTADKVEVLLNRALPTSLPSLLPHAFDTQELGVQPELLTQKDNKLMLINKVTGELADAALLAANKSYAPYSKCFAGVAVHTQDGNTFSGSYMENVAFNPSVGALHAALVMMVMSGYQSERICQCVLVCKRGDIVGHDAITKFLLKALQPGVKVDVFEAK